MRSSRFRLRTIRKPRSRFSPEAKVSTAGPGCDCAPMSLPHGGRAGSQSYSVGVATIVKVSGDRAHASEMARRESARAKAPAAAASPPAQQQVPRGPPAMKVVGDDGGRSLMQIGEKPFAFNLPSGTTVAPPSYAASDAATLGAAGVVQGVFEDTATQPMAMNAWGSRVRHTRKRTWSTLRSARLRPLAALSRYAEYDPQPC